MTRSLLHTVALSAAALLLGCVAAEPSVEDGAREPSDPLEPLRQFEEQRRAETDFARVPDADRALGADPYRLAALPGGERFAGVLRGADALVLLDASGRELQRVATPPAPSGIAIGDDGAIYVAGEAPRIARYRLDAAGAVAPDGALEIEGALALSDLALGANGTLVTADEVSGRVLAVATQTGQVSELGRCEGPIDVDVAGELALVNCLHERAVVVFRATPGIAPIARIEHDGPIWAVDAEVIGDRLVIALGGIEDRPLDRSDGFFGYIDSFAYLYELELANGELARVDAVNLSEAGVVTPRHVALRVDAGGALALDAYAYGSALGATLLWTGDGNARVQTAYVPPGTTAVVETAGGALAANPLLDAWVAIAPDGVAVQPVQDAADAPRDPASRVGEALMFTTLMAPFNPADGKRSRFTCESCHFEGYGDGRVHFTGRGDVHASTRPLRGLFNDRPYFSRALDRTMAQMVHNEFRVANATSGRSAWFALDAAEVPWLAHIDGAPETLSPLYLRRALMAFMMDFTHRPNPAARGRTAFSDAERAGAALFAEHCEGCHQARLSADEPDSRVPASQWEARVLSREGPIVWGTDAYEKTGVTPYVHDRGARVPSLRRLYKKRPYFTNGSAPDIASLLDAARIEGTVFYHAGAPADAEALSAGERAALEAFLRLL